MTEDQKKVILDYAQELQSNDEPWREYEWLNNQGRWIKCSEQYNPCRMLPCEADKDPKFRRKPRTITVTMPVPNDVTPLTHSAGYYYITTKYKTESDRDTALAAIREAMEQKS